MLSLVPAKRHNNWVTLKQKVSVDLSIMLTKKLYNIKVDNEIEMTT